MSLMKGMTYLVIAIIIEAIGTATLKASNGFVKPVPSIIAIIGYGSCFYFLALSLKTIPLGIGYALWSGVGTVSAVIIGAMIWKESLSLTNILGFCLVIAGVIILNIDGKVTSG